MSITRQEVFEASTDLSCDDQFALAQRLAANIGYVVVPEPAPFEIEPPSPMPALFTIDGVEFLEQDVPYATIAWRVRVEGDEFYVSMQCPDHRVDYEQLVTDARRGYAYRRDSGKPPTWPEP